ncbi:MAG: hypothetical protein H2069_02585 [Legionella sp.]|nr:hypothetical protein [Legionella sp.]
MRLPPARSTLALQGKDGDFITLTTNLQKLKTFNTSLDEKNPIPAKLLPLWRKRFFNKRRATLVSLLREALLKTPMDELQATLLSNRELQNLFSYIPKSQLKAVAFENSDIFYPVASYRRRMLFSFLKKKLQHSKVKKISMMFTEIKAKEIRQLSYNARQICDLSLTSYYDEKGEMMHRFGRCLKHFKQLISLNMSNGFVEDVNAIPFLKGLNRLPLKKLDLSRNYLGDEAITYLASTVILPQLESMDLSTNCISDIGIASLKNFIIKHPSLKILALGNNREYRNEAQKTVGDKGVIALASAIQQSQLEKLDLQCSHIGMEGFQALADHLPASLRCLDISYNRPFKGLAYLLNKVTMVEILDLRGWKLYDEDAQALHSLITRHSLRAVGLCNTMMDEHVKKSLYLMLFDKKLHRFVKDNAAYHDVNFKSFLLQYNYVTYQEKLTAIARGLKFFPNLRNLDLSDLHIETNVALSLSEGLNGLNLKSLNFSDNNFTNQEIIYFAKEVRLPQLENLDFGRNRIDDIGFSSLAKFFTSHPTLKTLALAINPFYARTLKMTLSDTGVVAIATALKNSKLEALDLTGAHIGQTGLHALADNLPKSLKMLNLNGNTQQASPSYLLKELNNIEKLYLQKWRINPEDTLQIRLLIDKGNLKALDLTSTVMDKAIRNELHVKLLEKEIKLKNLEQCENISHKIPRVFSFFKCLRMKASPQNSVHYPTRRSKPCETAKERAQCTVF